MPCGCSPALAVLAYAIGIAGVRGTVPRLAGLVGLSLGVATTVVAFFFGLPRPPPRPHRPGNLLPAQHDRPPRRRARQQGRRDARLDRRGAADRRPKRRRSSSRDAASAGNPLTEAERAHVLPAGARQYPHAQRSAIHAPGRHACRCDGPVHPGALARAARRLADGGRAPRRPLCLRPAAAPLPRRPHRRGPPARALSRSCGFPGRRSCARSSVIGGAPAAVTRAEPDALVRLVTEHARNAGASAWLLGFSAHDEPPALPATGTSPPAGSPTSPTTRTGGSTEDRVTLVQP